MWLKWHKIFTIYWKKKEVTKLSNYNATFWQQANEKFHTTGHHTQCGYQQETMIDTNSRGVRATGDRFDMEETIGGERVKSTLGDLIKGLPYPSVVEAGHHPSFNRSIVTSCQKFDTLFYRRAIPASPNTIYSIRLLFLVSLTSHIRWNISLSTDEIRMTE